ncbi:MAG: hypothetical protein ACRDNB_12935, partial [Gaiellaceae bacterium]
MRKVAAGNVSQAPPLHRRPGAVVLLALAGLALFRTGLSLAALARSGSSLLPGFPVYEYEPRPGDAYGYHSAMRDLLATPPRLGWMLPLAVAAAGGLVAAAISWRRRSL